MRRGSMSRLERAEVRQYHRDPRPCDASSGQFGWIWGIAPCGLDLPDDLRTPSTRRDTTLVFAQAILAQGVLV